jgi:hypothetical protein
MADKQHIPLDEIIPYFHELEDPRSTVNRQHPLVSVVVIALMAILAGASGPTSIAKRAAIKEEFLSSVLDLPNGIPRKDVSSSRVDGAAAGCLSSVFRELVDLVA